MKVEIDQGMLLVTPETPTEAYALTQWWAAFSPSFKLGAGAVPGTGIGIKELAKAPAKDQE